MGDIIQFNEHKNEKKYQNVKIISTRKNFKNVVITVKQSCLNFNLKREISDRELKIIYNELANMLAEINPVFYEDILPLYMNRVINYCCNNKVPLTAQAYIKELDCLRHYLEKRWNYKIEKNVIEEEKEKLTELMQRR